MAKNDNSGNFYFNESELSCAFKVCKDHSSIAFINRRNLWPKGEGLVSQMRKKPLITVKKSGKRSS